MFRVIVFLLMITQMLLAGSMIPRHKKDEFMPLGMFIASAMQNDLGRYHSQPEIRQRIGLWNSIMETIERIFLESGYITADLTLRSWQLFDPRGPQVYLSHRT